MGEYARPSYLNRQALEIDRRNDKTKMSIIDLMQKVQKNRRKQAQANRATFSKKTHHRTRKQQNWSALIDLTQPRPPYPQN